MKLNLASIVLLLPMILFSGCISIEVKQEITPNGLSSVEVRYDLSAMNAMAEDMAGNDNSEPEESYCAEFENVTLNAGFECSEPKKGVIVLSGEWQSSEPYFVVKKSFLKTTYEYDAMEVFDILSKLSEDEEEQLTKESLAGLKMLNPTFEYVITMPAAILSSEVGDIKENSVEIDIFDLSDIDSAKIISVQKNNAVLYALIGIAVIFVIAVAILFIRKKKHPIQSNNIISETETRYRDYIIQNRSYPRDALKNSIVGNGLDSQTAEEYLNKYYNQ